MKARVIFLFALFIVPALFVAPSDACLADETIAEDDVTAIVFDGPNAEIHARTRAGLSFQVPAGKVEDFCYRPFYGVGLAECIEACDQGRIVALGAEPDFDAVARTAEALRMDHATVPYRFSGRGSKLVRLKRGSEIALRFELPQQVVGPTTCDASEHGIRCLADLAKTLLTERFIQEYPGKLSVLGTTTSNPERRSPVLKLAALAAEVEELLRKNGLSDFRQSGFFYARNFRNAAALVCMLSETDERFGPRLQKALEENRAELEKSREFLLRLLAEQAG